MGNLKDFATGIVATAPSPATSGTSLVLESGHGARMPATPFFAVAHAPSDVPTLDTAEKIQVTNVSTNTLTIVRAQGSTTAKAIEAGWRITNAVFKSDFDDKADSSALTSHTGNTSNPHNVTKAQIGLSNVPNTDFTSAVTANTDKVSVTDAADDSIPIGKLSYQLGPHLFGRTSGSVGSVSALTSAQARTLLNVEDGADVTDSTSVNAAGATMNTDTSLSGNSYFLDEDTMSSNSPTKVASQQSIKTYIDAAIAATKEALHPVGSVYISADSTNPGTSLGFGTWVADSEGHAIVGKEASGAFSTAGAELGSNEQSILTGNMPNHSHDSGSLSTNTQGGSGQVSFHGAGSATTMADASGILTDLTARGSYRSGGSNIGGAQSRDGFAINTSHSHSISGSTGSEGGGTPLDIIQRSKVFYVWRRTA